MRALATIWLAVLLCVANILQSSAKMGAELIMVEQAGCEWCEVWDREIAPILPKIPEGKCAKFRRVDLHAPKDDLLERIRPIVYTLTFLVMEDGKEVGRLLGYAGEDFFWFLLGKQLKKLKSGCKLSE